MALSAEALAGRFRGCLVGSLLGDCFGAPYEGESRVALSVINKYFNGLNDPILKVPFKPYTDDTAMTRCVAQSLINNKGYNAKDMAKRFVTEYYADPKRRYGRNVVDVFAALRATKFNDPYSPAQMQFGGTGSYGNGGSMRIAPVALFTVLENTDTVVDLAKKSSQITHANRYGYNGAVLQCLAVYYALRTPSNTLDPRKYIEQLILDMNKYEPPQDDEIVEGKISLVYVNKLKLILGLINKSSSTSSEEIEELLGTDVSGPGSVPTAIYSFLNALTPIAGMETDNCFQRTLQYAISLGGDTDTIASMAGSIAGAYYGVEAISDVFQKRCEGLSDAIELSDQLLEIIKLKNIH